MSMNATSDRTELTSRAERIDAADYLLLDDGDMSGPKYGTDPERVGQAVLTGEHSGTDVVPGDDTTEPPFWAER